MSWLQTRESSTLVIVTFLASASLLLLTVPFDNMDDEHDDDEFKLDQIAPVGFSFAFIGLLYRQATTWSIDRIQHNVQVDIARAYVQSFINTNAELRTAIANILRGINLAQINSEIVRKIYGYCQHDGHLAEMMNILHGRNQRRIYYVYSGIREFLVIWFLAIPIVLWGYVWNYGFSPNQYWLIWQIIVIFSAITGGGITGVDLALRRHDRRVHPAEP